MAKGLAKLFRYGFGALDDLGMFSPTEKAIDMLPQQTGTPEQMFSQIGKIGGKGVKEEMLFTGIEDAFATAPKVTNQQLKDYLSKNKTRINEIVKSEAKAKEKGQITYFKHFDPNVLTNITRDGRRLRILDGFTTGDDYTLKFIDDLAKDPNRTGTLDNPFISKIDQDELSDNFYGAIDRKYFEQVEQLDDNEEILGLENTNKADLYAKLRDKNLENLIKVRFIDEDKIAYTIRGNNNVGYEVQAGRNLDKNAIDDVYIARTDNFNEAVLQLNEYRRQAQELGTKNQLIKDTTIDLRPKHESYTLPGGKNYQEILLTMPEPIDNVASIAGKYDDVIQKDRFGAIINLNPITGSPSDITLSPSMLKTLDDGKVLDIGIDSNIRFNKETDNIEILKKDYVNTAHTGDEKNVVVFARTKDRVDEDGRKILYTEEIQSDMAQRGRKQGFVMGQKEKKAYINKNNPIIFGDILDSIDKLKSTTNIGDLKAIRTSQNNPKDVKIGQIQPARQTIGFDNDDAVIYFNQTASDTFSDGTKFDKAHKFEDIVKKQQTKYKFNELKNNSTKRLTNQGFNKTNINEIDKDVLEDVGITVPKDLYTDVSDYVDMSLFKKRIEAFRKATAEKIYDREFNKTFGPLDDAGDPIDRIDPQKLVDFNNNILKKILGTENHKKFINNSVKEQTKESLELFTNMNPTSYNKLKDDETMDMTLSQITSIPDLEDGFLDRFNVMRQRGMTKAEFKELVIAPKIQSDMNSTLNNLLKILIIQIMQ
jgi:hypothetical protein